MDNEMIKKGMQALRWESFYRLKTEEENTNHFLAPTSVIDNDFEKYIEELDILGTVLDVGTGLGEQAVFLAQKGFEVTATDVSITALKQAQKLAADQDVNVEFVEDSILNTRLASQYDLIIDRGCFTVLPPAYSSDYISSVRKLLKLNGWFFLKADKNKKELIAQMVDEAYFAIHSLCVSSYPGVKKNIPAILLIARKVA